MGKILLPVLLLFLIFWLIGGSWWYAHRYHHQIVNNIAITSSSERSFYPTEENASQEEEIAPIKIQPSNIIFKDQEHDVSLTPELRQYLEDLKYYLEMVPEANVVLIGHTDNRGSEKSNLALSKTRARSVKDFLIDLGFNEHQLNTKYRGSKEPRASNDTKAGRIKNRRVEIRIR